MTDRSGSDPGSASDSDSRPAFDSRTVPFPGSDRSPGPGSTTSDGVPAGTPVGVTLVLRRRAALPPDVVTGPPVPAAEFAERYGADPADVDVVTAWATDVGLTVAEVDPASRRVRVTGPVQDVARAFGTDLRQAQVGGVSYRARTGELHVPAGIAGRVVAVLGVDDRPQARSRAVVAPRAAVSTSYTPVQLATVYGMPAADGAGRTIAIVELGGGYREDDLATYFDSLGVPAPRVTAVGVDGAANVPGADPDGADGEVLLDIEVAGGIAPGADIVVYFAPNTDAGFVDAVSRAAHATPTPTAISISWGQSEDAWTVQARTAMDDAFADAAALGVTVTVAAGDDGSTDRQDDGGVHVDFPASSPHALACGGTALHADATSGAVTSETVWGGTPDDGATGGGVSIAFPRPDWQRTAGVPSPAGTAAAGGSAAGSGADGSAAAAGRGVPDVAAVADPRTGYEVLVDGRRAVIGGTSAVAPLWAGLVCRLAQRLDRSLGLLQPALYADVAPGRAQPGFQDIVAGSNGAYTAGPGWDACTGLGVPDGEALLARLTSAGR